MVHSLTIPLLLVLLPLLLLLNTHTNANANAMQVTSTHSRRKMQVGDIPSSFYDRDTDAPLQGDDNDLSLSQLFNMFDEEPSSLDIDEYSQSPRFTQIGHRNKNRNKNKHSHKATSKTKTKSKTKTAQQTPSGSFTPAYSLGSFDQISQKFPSLFASPNTPNSPNSNSNINDPSSSFRFAQQQQQLQHQPQPQPQAGLFTGPGTPLGQGIPLTMYPPVGPPPPAGNQVPTSSYYSLPPNGPI